MDITNRWYAHLTTERKLSPDVIKMTGLEVKNGLLKIPIYDKEGVHIFSKYRKAPWDETETPKYQYDTGAKVSLYGIDHIGAEMIITEGEIDTLTLLSCGYNACTSTGGSLSFQKEWGDLFIGKNVTILYDNDETGIKGAVKTGFILHSFIYRWVNIRHCKDISDVLQQYDRERVNEIMHSKENCIRMDVPDLSTKKAIREYRRILSDKVRKFSVGNVGAMFLRQMIVELSTMLSTGTKSKMPERVEDDRVIRARQYPIENIIKVVRGIATCPFHSSGQEATASLHVYKDNHAYCFGGCRKRYDSIEIARKIKALTFTEAIDYLQ